MKKLISLMIALCILCTLAACGDKQQPTSSGNESKPPIQAENNWDDMLDEENFENVTLKYSAEFIDGYEGEEGVISDTYKIDGDMISVNDEPAQEDATTIKSLHDIMLKAILGALKNPDDFKYDKKNDSYNSSNPIVYDVEIKAGMATYDVTITATDVKVTIDEQGHIFNIVCRMQQDFTFEGETNCYLLDTEFTFTDYGTTTP